MNNLLSVKQVAFILKVHPLSIRRYIKEKKLHAIKVGGNIRISEADLEKFHEEIAYAEKEKGAFRQMNFFAAKEFTPGDPFLRLQGRGASLELS